MWLRSSVVETVQWQEQIESLGGGADTVIGLLNSTSVLQPASRDERLTAPAWHSWVAFAFDLRPLWSRSPLRFTLSSSYLYLPSPVKLLNRMQAFTSLSAHFADNNYSLTPIELNSHLGCESNRPRKKKSFPICYKFYQPLNLKKLYFLIKYLI